MPGKAAIGLTGFAKAGKDSVGKILVEDYGYIRASFADVLREALYRLNPTINVVDTAGFPSFTFESAIPHYPQQLWTLRDLVDEVGWDDAKTRHPEVRRLLQVMGTEVGRQLLYEDVWVDAVLMKLNPLRHYVFTDVRFSNEAFRIRLFFRDVGGAQIWRIVRPGIGPINVHASEAGLPDGDIDREFWNSHDIPYLREIIGDYLS
jgi:hypothetical protein